VPERLSGRAACGFFSLFQQVVSVRGARHGQLRAARDRAPNEFAAPIHGTNRRLDPDADTLRRNRPSGGGWPRPRPARRRRCCVLIPRGASRRLDFLRFLCAPPGQPFPIPAARPRALCRCPGRGWTRIPGSRSCARRAHNDPASRRCAALVTRTPVIEEKVPCFSECAVRILESFRGRWRRARRSIGAEPARASGQCAEAGGIDLIIHIQTSGRYAWPAG